jgi:hypothetical protein
VSGRKLQLCACKPLLAEQVRNVQIRRCAPMPLYMYSSNVLNVACNACLTAVLRLCAALRVGREDPWFTPADEDNASQGGAAAAAAAAGTAAGADSSSRTSLNGTAAADEQQRRSESAGNAAGSAGGRGSAGGGSWSANAVAAGGKISAL